LKEAKKVATQWDKDKKQKDVWILKELEEGLETLYNSEGFGYLVETWKLEVKQLEEKKRGISYNGEREGMEAREQGHLTTSR
jgi:hypothetical protein